MNKDQYYHAEKCQESEVADGCRKKMPNLRSEMQPRYNAAHLVKARLCNGFLQQSRSDAPLSGLHDSEEKCRSLQAALACALGLYLVRPDAGQDFPIGLG